MARGGIDKSKTTLVIEDARDVFESFTTSLQKWFILAAILGAIAGMGVAGAALIGEQFLEGAVLDSRIIWVFLFTPAAGLLIAKAVITWLTPDRSTATTEAFIGDYHSPDTSLGWRSIPGKFIAAIATIGSGGSLGFEGPSIYFGAATGSTEQAQFANTFGKDESKVLTVAGAAAGLSAIFRAPLTGVLFAVEGPYMFDLVRFAVAPSLIASATSYFVYTSIRGSEPFFAVSQGFVLDYRQLLAAIALGIVCAVVTRALLYVLSGARWIAEKLNPWVVPVVAGLVIGILGLVSYWMVGVPLTLGEGVRGARSFVDSSIYTNMPSLGFVIMALVAMKIMATAATAKGGGVGGFFFPLSFIGAGIGAFFHLLFPLGDASFFPVIGIAAMISAAFRAPLTAVAFIAETTGTTSYLIPGLIAAAAANSLMGKKSISEVQADHRSTVTTLVRRIPVARMLAQAGKPRIVAAGTSLHDYASGPVQRPAVVMDDDKIEGLMTKDCLFACRLEDRRDASIGDVMDKNPLVFDERTPLREVVGALVDNDKFCAIVTQHGKPVGVVTGHEILQRQERTAAAVGTDMD